MRNILDTMPLRPSFEIRGPTGDIVYLGAGRVAISGQQHIFTRISLVLGGSDITPGYALIARAVLEAEKEEAGVRFRAVDANKTESDILLQEELKKLEGESGGR